MKLHVHFGLYQDFISATEEDQGHKTVGFKALPVHTYIPYLTGLHKIFFQFSTYKRPKCEETHQFANLISKFNNANLISNKTTVVV